ncbi:MAG: hypothetical protein EU544_02765 [Promethearchaeota archaeon]|nr:MAG: hypothetical protein EU544_02765 [Candidatus Lokiarchaeota archaeon]
MYITFLSYKEKEKEAFINNIAISVVFLVALTTNVIFIHIGWAFHGDFLVFPFDILMILFICIFLPLFGLLILREKRIIKNMSKKKEKERDSVSNEKEIKKLPLKFDIYRKLTHLVVLSIIFFYFTLGFLIQNLFIYLLSFYPPEISNAFFSFFLIDGNLMIFTQYLVTFLVGISVIGLLSADIVRILKPEFYPLKPVNKILRPKELKLRLGPQISMAIGCFSIIIIFGWLQPLGPFIICLSMTMAILSDMASNIVGRTLGKRKIRNTEKTWEGWIAGLIVAYLSGVIIILILRFFYKTELLVLMIFPLIGTLIIGFLDYSNPEIDDNLTYNVLTSSILFILALLII